MKRTTKLEKNHGAKIQGPKDDRSKAQRAPLAQQHRDPESKGIVAWELTHNPTHGLLMFLDYCSGIDTGMYILFWRILSNLVSPRHTVRLG
jgi:hypothetical protein